MPSEILRQSNFTGGELDPNMLGRRELKAYFTTLAGAQNMMPMPQGPIVRRPGFAYVAPIRNPLVAVAIPAGAITAPNGGTADDARAPGFIPSPTTTADLGTTDPYVILAFDFGAPVAVGLVDVVDYCVVPDSDSTGDVPNPTDPFPGGFDFSFNTIGFL